MEVNFQECNYLFTLNRETKKELKIALIQIRSTIIKKFILLLSVKIFIRSKWKIKWLIKINIKNKNIDNFKEKILKKLSSLFIFDSPRVSALSVEYNPSIKNWEKSKIKDKYTIRYLFIKTKDLVFINSTRMWLINKPIKKKPGIKYIDFGLQIKINLRVFKPSFIVFKWLLLLTLPSL